MKKLEFETIKGRFVVKEYDTFNDLVKDANFYKQKICKLSEITEEQASEIVDDELYDYVLFRGHLQNYCETAIESLHSLLKSKGIKITNNTYIFKL